MIDGSCYREGRSWKIFVIFGWHCFCFLFISSHLPSLPSRGKWLKGEDSEQKNRKTKHWKHDRLEGFFSWASVPALHVLFSSLFSIQLSSFRHFFVDFHLSMSYDSIVFSFCLHFRFLFVFPVEFPASFYPGTASEFWSACVCHIILNRESQRTWSYILMPSKGQ